MSRERTCTSLCDVENFYNSQVRLLQSNTETAIVWQCRLFYLDKSWTRGAATVLSKPLQIAVFHWRASVNVEIECKCGMDVLQEQHDPRSGIPGSQDPILGSRRFIQISTHCPCNFPSSPNSDSHSHSLSSNTDDVSPTYDHWKQFCPKIILMTLTIRSLAILPSCSDGGSLLLEWTMTRVLFIAQNSIK